jgi:glucokinase
MGAPGVTVGVDIGGTNIRAAIVDAEGQVGERIKFRTQGERGPQAAVEDLGERLLALMEGHEVIGIGVGCPGPLDSTRGVTLHTPNLPGWSGFALAPALSNVVHRPVELHNDANAAAYGEFLHGAGRDANTIIMYTLGTGVGGGLVIDGHLIVGPDTTAGELGHMVVVANGRRCGCGVRGCLEAYASASSVARIARERLLGGDNPSALRDLGIESITAHDVDHAADAGDEFSIDLLRETGRHLGLAAAGLVNALNPEMIIYGGGMTAAHVWLFPVIQETIREHTFKAPAERVRIVRAELGDDAGIVGVAGLAARA